MAQVLFEDWLINCFIPQVHEYCLERGVPFKILLLLDNASRHPMYLNDLHPDVKVVFGPQMIEEEKIAEEERGEAKKEEEESQWIFTSKWLS